MTSIIRNIDKVTRALDFTELNRGSTMSKDSRYASDIDCVMEFNDTYLITIEIKEHHKELPTGQRLLLERINNAWCSTGRKGVVIYATHDQELTGGIRLSDCIVKKVHYNGTWIESHNKTLLETIHNLGKSWGIDKLRKAEQR